MSEHTRDWAVDSIKIDESKYLLYQYAESLKVVESYESINSIVFNPSKVSTSKENVSDKRIVRYVESRKIVNRIDNVLNRMQEGQRTLINLYTDETDKPIGSIIEKAGMSREQYSLLVCDTLVEFYDLYNDGN